jgi:hypothetical protein
MLSYTLKLALRREIESLSPDRQSGRLTRCVTEQEFYGAQPLRVEITRTSPVMTRTAIRSA